MTDTLQDLLARAIELEEKAADVLDRELTPDARADYESLAEAPPAEAVAELSARLESLHNQIAAVGAEPAAEPAEPAGEVDEKGWGDFGEDLAAAELKADDELEELNDDEEGDEPAGMDFDEPDDEAKADVGEPDELDAWADAEEPEVKSLEGAESTEVLSEFELLRARRTELGI